MNHEAKRLAPISPARVCLFDRQLRAVQHARAKDLVGIVVDRSEKTDADFTQIGRLRQVAPRARVDVGMGVVQFVRRRKLGVRAQVRGLAGVRRN